MGTEVIELHQPIEQIVRECEDGATQQCVAQTYALALRHSRARELDWPRANRAILDRWSLRGLERIKRMAWSGKAFDTPKGRKKR